MPEYCYRTESGRCECTGVCPEGCNGRFIKLKPISQASSPEECRVCGAPLKKDFPQQGAPSAQFKGTGFHKTDY